MCSPTTKILRSFTITADSGAAKPSPSAQARATRLVHVHSHDPATRRAHQGRGETRGARVETSHHKKGLYHFTRPKRSTPKQHLQEAKMLYMEQSLLSARRLSRTMPIQVSWTHFTRNLHG